jgi:hypothetical protein
MNNVISATELAAAACPRTPDGQGGGAAAPPTVNEASDMASRCESTMSVVRGAGDLEGEGFDNLQRVGGPSAPAPKACLRQRDLDLVICDGAGLALYLLRITPTTLSWEQRVISYPSVEELQAVRERPDWPRRARQLCLVPADARSCRVPVGVVAAEARAAEECDELEDGEEAVYRLCEAAAARHQTLGKLAARAGRHLQVEVDKARRPSHVPLYRLQRALAEELALGHSVAALCSRAEGFSDSEDESKVTSLLCRRLGVLGHRDCFRQLRYGRVVSSSIAELLCEVLDMAPEQVGL